jgi:hypothetical protein
MNKLEKQVLQLIGENTSSPDVFKDTDSGLEPIRDSINAAIEEISMLTGMYRERYLLPLYTQQGFYRMNFSRGQFAYVTSAYLMNNRRKLEQTSIGAMSQYGWRWMTQVSTPHSYMQIGMDVVGIYPRPGGSDDVVELECAVIPDRYNTSTDRIKLRESFEKSVVHYAVSEYWASRGDARSAQQHLVKYADALGLIRDKPIAGDKTHTQVTHSHGSSSTVKAD